MLGPSGSGKTTLVRALAGLVPHFHGGRFSGSVEVAGRDTRQTRPAELAGTVGTLFQDPEDQIVFGGVEAEVAFGIENAGAPPEEIADRVAAALGVRGRRAARRAGAWPSCPAVSSSASVSRARSRSSRRCSSSTSRPRSSTTQPRSR